MTMFRFLSIAAFVLWSTLTHAAGFTFIEVPADKDGPALRGAVWSPCKLPAEQIALGPMVIDGAKECSISGTRLPLIVISHGKGGSFLGHHDTASALADADFVVAAISHPGDNYADPSRKDYLSAFATRPVDMKRLVDYMLDAWPSRTKLDADKIGLFGFSRGGYTGLASVGAIPNWALRMDLCPPKSATPLCGEIRRNELPAPPAPDQRIKAAVIVDPLIAFDADGLKRIRVPIQLWASEYGGDGVTPQSVAALQRELPAPPDWHVATKAAHFAFLAPCSPTLTNMAPQICNDGSGFDRTAFHVAFNSEVLAFFQRHLAQISKP